MMLEREKRKNKELRKSVQNVIESKCKELDVIPIYEYHIFVDGKNTGETAKMPSCFVDKICDAISDETKYFVSLSHRNIYLKHIVE